MKKHLALLLLLLPFIAGAQTEHYARTLLWRITGKGMPHPSYLYGTMHVRTRRLFDFPDSLYTAIGNTDVFSLEINPDSMNSGLTDYLNKIIDDKLDNKKSEDRQLKDILTPKELKTLKENLADNKDVDPERLTLKQIYLMRDRLKKHKAAKDDMPTFMDAYLYTIARDKHKQMAGLERMEDQMNLLENVDMNDVNPEKLIAYFKDGGTTEDKLAEIYEARDLDRLQQVSEIFSEKTEQALLSNRNKHMLVGMDSIMQQHSLFCAVGSLHLPGKLGLISLLRQAGYTVEPVMCATVTNGADYQFHKSDDTWPTITFAGDGYSIKMPGQPNDLDAYGGTVKMKIYFDLGSSRYYMTTHIPKPEGVAVDASSVIDVMEKAMMKNPHNLQKKQVSAGTLTGRDYIFTDDNKLHYHVQMLFGSNDIYMLMSYATTDDDDAAAPFFNSFRIIPKTASKIVSKRFDDIYLAAAVPDLKPVRKVSYSSDSSQRTVSYTITDAVTGMYYFIVSNESQEGYNYDDDGMWRKSLYEIFNDEDSLTITQLAYDNGAREDDFKARNAKGYRSSGRLIYHGNRVYKIAAQYPDNKQAQAAADSFMESVDLLTVPLQATRTEICADGKFSAKVPGPLELRPVNSDDQPADSTLPTEYTYRYWDNAALETYNVSVKKLSEFYWGNYDSTRLKLWLKRRFVNTDTLPVYSFYKENGHTCAEVVLSKKDAAQIHRIKVIGNGRTRYTLEMTYPRYLKDSTQFNAFFSTFKILQPDNESLQKGPAKLFSMLHSGDTTEFRHALASLGEVAFTKNDIPAITKELCKPFPDDDSSQAAAGGLLNSLNSIDGGVPVADLAALYKCDAMVKRGFQLSLLKLLLLQDDSVAAYKTAKELMMAMPPAGAYEDLLDAFYSHPVQAAKMFPDVLQLTADSLLGFTLCALAEELVDSGFLQTAQLNRGEPMLLQKSRELRQGQDMTSCVGMIMVLVKMNTPAAWNEIALYQANASNGTQLMAIRQLCDSGHAVDGAAISAVAANRNYRRSLYDLLQRTNRLQYLPETYATQQSMAEGYLADLDDDGVYDKYIPMGMKHEDYQGKKQRFYLYRMLPADTASQELLGVAGPFSDNDNELTIDPDANVTGLYDEPADKSRLNTQLRLYLISKKLDDAGEAPQQQVDLR